MTEHNHDDIFMDLDRLFEKASKLGDRISDLEYTVRSKETDLYIAEGRIKDLENRVSNLERGY